LPSEKLSQLPAGTTISSGDLWYSDQSGSSVSQSSSAIKTFCFSIPITSFAFGNIATFGQSTLYPGDPVNAAILKPIYAPVIETHVVAEVAANRIVFAVATVTLVAAALIVLAVV